MPIQPPRSGMSLLSPAALLGRSRERERSPIQSMLNQYMNFSLNKQLQDRSYELAAERDLLNRRNRQIDELASGVARGTLLPEDYARTYVGDILFPGEEAAFDIPTIEGPGGNKYVSTAALTNSLQAITQQRPVGGTVGPLGAPMRLTTRLGCLQSQSLSLLLMRFGRLPQ